MTNIPDYKPHKPSNKPTNIDDTLKELNDKLTTAKSDVEEKTQTRDTLQTEVTDLTKIHDDADQIHKAYQDAYEQNLAKKNEIDTYIPKEYDEITGSLSTQVMEKIDQIIKEVRTDIHEKEQYVAELKNLCEEAQKEYNDDNQAFEEANNNFESFKTKEKTIEDTLTHLNDLKAKIEKNASEEKEGYLLKNYYWIKKLIHDNKGFKIETQSEFWNTYNHKWYEMEGAKEKSKASETKMNTAKDKYLKEKDKLQQMKDNFDDDIIKKISNIAVSECLKNQTTNTEQYNVE